MVDSSNARRTHAQVVLTLALVATVAVPASAGPRVFCVANGNVVIEGEPGAWNWTVGGLGPCVSGTLRGNYNVVFSGTGTSDSLGLCDGVVVTNLNIDVKATVTNLRTGQVYNVTERWRAPLTTFPLVTPFLVSGGGESGAGVIATRVLLNCPPGGATVATFAFTTTT